MEEARQVRNVALCGAQPRPQSSTLIRHAFAFTHNFSWTKWWLKGNRDFRILQLMSVGSLCFEATKPVRGKEGRKGTKTRSLQIRCCINLIQSHIWLLFLAHWLHIFGALVSCQALCFTATTVSLSFAGCVFSTSPTSASAKTSASRGSLKKASWHSGEGFRTFSHTESGRFERALSSASRVEIARVTTDSRDRLTDCDYMILQSTRQ